jgi:hypothetical protein
MTEAFRSGWELQPRCFLGDPSALSCIYGWNHVMPPVPMVVAQAATVLLAGIVVVLLVVWVRVMRGIARRSYAR